MCPFNSRSNGVLFSGLHLVNGLVNALENAAIWLLEIVHLIPIPPFFHSSVALQTHSLLPALTKNRVSQKPKSRRPSRRPHIESEHDNSSIETSQL